MMPRTEYEMTPDDMERLLEASRPVPAMMIGGHAPNSPQENANNAWAALGEKMGFNSMTVRPVGGKGQRFFTAVPNETCEARTERLAREDEERRSAKIETLKAEIAEREASLKQLTI